MTRAEYAEQRFSWNDIDLLVNKLAAQLRGQHFDLFLGICRGGLIPAGLLAKRLNHFHLLVASMRYYDDEDNRLAEPVILELPEPDTLRGKRVLIIDDVWDSGNTIDRIKKHVLAAGGKPLVATLHFKPKRSEVPGKPDFYGEQTDAWIVYPWELL